MGGRIYDILGGMDRQIEVSRVTGGWTDESRSLL